MNKPVENATLTGAEAVVEMLRAHGVEVIFGLCGDTSLPLYDAMARLGSMRHILTRDERHAAYMADGYARLSGKVGVCEGPSGGGATYILPGLVEANESSVPILAINTDVSVSSRGKFTLTELDQRALMKPLTKWNAVLDRSADIPRVLRKAFEAMTTGRPGAAHIALPFDVQNGPVERGDVWADPTLGSFPSRRVAPDPSLVELGAKLLRRAKNPLFICGGGVVLSGAEARAAGARRDPRRAGGHDHQRQGLDRRAQRAARSAWSDRTAARRRRARWSMPRTWWCSSAAAPAR